MRGIIHLLIFTAVHKLAGLISTRSSSNQFIDRSKPLKQRKKNHELHEIIMMLSDLTSHLC